MNTPLRTFLLALCLWAAAPNIHAQSTADSLRRLILPAVDDTLKVRRLVELAKILTGAGKYDSALAAANWAQMLAERLKYQKGLADALLQQGTVYHKQSRLQTALEIYKHSLPIAEQRKDKQVLAIILNNLGRVYADKSQYPSALEYLLRSLKIREELGEKQGLVGVLNNIGILYYFQAEYSSAFAYYNKALKISEESGDKRGISSSLLNLGDIYLYDGQKRFAEALATYQKSLILKQEINDKRGISICKTYIGNSFTALGQLDSALLYQNQAYTLASEVDNHSWMAFSLHGTAIVHTKQGKYAQALPKAQKALELRIQSGERKEASETQALLATIHAALGNYKAAYTAQSEHHALKDSLFNADNAKRLSALQADYDAQKQAAEQKFREAEARHKAELATQEKERQTQLQYAAIAGVVLLVLALALASRRVSTESTWGWCFVRLILSLAFSSCFFLTESYGNAVNRYRIFSGNKDWDDSTKTVQNKLGIVQTMMTQPPPTLKGDIQVFRVDGNGAEYPLTCLKVEDTISKQFYPFLPIIFFDKNSDSLPRRYKRFVQIEGDCCFCRFYNIGMMSIYYDVLNVIGKRLKEKPSSKITLTGCNDGLPGSEKGNKKLSMQRAVTVRDYLVKTWDVDSTRMKLEARGLPVYATTSVDTLEGAEENRRVEISSNDPSVLEPLQIFDTLRVCNVPKIRVRMKSEAEAGFERSFMRVCQGSRILKEVQMSSAPLAVYDWNIKDEPFTIPYHVGDLDVELELYDKAKQKVVETAPVPVEGLDLAKKKELKIKDKTMDVFRLISFPFNSVQMGKRNDEIVKKYVNPYLIKESRVVVTGYTDKLDRDINQRLSDGRAKSVADALKAGQVTSLGVGNRHPLYTNDQPEGRFYNRMVEVRVETPVDYGK